MEPLINKYIDPMVDYGFKRIFKESGKKQLIIRPINAVFGLDIVDVDIRDSEQLGLTENERFDKPKEESSYLRREARVVLG